MSIVALSVSHQNAPIELLERVTLSANQASELARELSELDHVRECLTLATCNRVEVYLVTEEASGAIIGVLDVMARHCSIDVAKLRAHLDILLEDDAIAHVFRLAAGLKSMVLGEGQILGQLRDALTRSQLDDTIGPELNAVMQKALKAGKRAHAETEIDCFAPSIVTAALDQVRDRLSTDSTRFLIAGAGTMSVLSVLTLLDRGVAPRLISVANRAHGRALDLAEKHGINAVRWESLDVALLNVDVLITCTGAADVIFDVPRLRPRLEGRGTPSDQFVVLDLALPRDVAPEVRSLANVDVIDLETLRDSVGDLARDAALLDVQSIVEWDLAAHFASRREAQAMPTVVALHDKARDVVETEFARLDTRLAELDGEKRAEIKKALQRVARKLIHEPTVRLKTQAAANPVEVDVESLAAILLAENLEDTGSLIGAGEIS